MIGKAVELSYAQQLFYCWISAGARTGVAR